MKSKNSLPFSPPLFFTKGVSRRDFLKGLGGGAIGTAVISTGLLDPGKSDAYPTESVGTGRGKSAINLKVNGKAYRLEVEHRETLAELLRDQLDRKSVV